MVIVFNATGNHSNRLFQNLHFQAFCMENSIKFANPSFSDMAYLYETPPDSCKEKISAFFRSKLMRNLRKTQLFKNIITFKTENEDNPNLLKKLSAHKDCFVDGWGFRDRYSTKKYQNEFIEKFKLKEIFYTDNALVKHIKEIDRTLYAVVGIHIRRGDYRTWLDGRYFYSDAEYQKSMEDISRDIRTKHNKETIFVIFSNEQVEFQEEKNISISKNEWFIDQYILSICDYIIGPPSTFTLWASYIGKTPYYHIIDANEECSLDKFTLCIG